MKKSKVLKNLMILAIFLIQIFFTTNKVKAISIGENENLERGEKGYYCVQKWNGSRWIYLTYNQTFYTDTDGQRYIAYCLSPGLPGVGYVSGEKENYQVKVKELLSNDVIWRILKNGYPNKSVSDLGVETTDDAYFATMQAINAILRGYTVEQAKELYTVGKFSINGENLEDIQRRGIKTLNAMFNLMENGLNGTETRNDYLNISIVESSDFQKENDEYYSKVFAVQSSAEILEYNIENVENFPEKSIITSVDGKEKKVFEGGERFKIMIPKDSIVNDINGKIHIKAKQKDYPVYYGESLIEGYQDYALCNNSYSEIFVESDIYIKTDKSKLEITKLDKDTRIPLQGVKFQITSTDGITNTYVTDQYGKISLANQRPGIIKIKEIETKEDYILNDNEFKVELKYDETKEIEIENEIKRGSIKIIKTDKDDREKKLENVKFQLIDNANNIIEEKITDVNGELLFENVKIGKYKIVEVETREEYTLLNEVIEVEVEEGVTKEVSIENELKKGSIRIIKIDKDNSELRIPNVEFEIYDEDENFIEVLKTDERGEAISKDLPINKKYKVQEIKTGEEYVLDNIPKIVELKQNEITTITFTNEKKKGKIKIIKVETEDNEVRIPNVVFKIYDEDGQEIETLNTDENGEAISNELPIDKKYMIKEIQTAEMYVLDDTIKTVTLKQDEITILKFENECKKGNIKIIKVDKDNNEIKIKNVKFQLKDERDNVIMEGKTDERGELIFEKIKVGNYKIVEIETDSEYELLDKDIEIEISYNETKELKIENNKKYIEENSTEDDEEEIIEDNEEELEENNEEEIEEKHEEEIEENNEEEIEEKYEEEIKEEINEEEIEEKYEEEIKEEINEEEIKKEIEKNDKEKVEESHEEKIEEKEEQNKLQVEEVETKKELPKTGNTDSTFSIIGNIILVGISGMYLVLKK